ncbi:hypothetical protein AB3X55_00195 [Alphaproteobacteria bacterium LSUCC0719]
MKPFILLQTVFRRLVASPNACKYMAANRAAFKRPKIQIERHVLINQIHSYPPIELYAHAGNYLANIRKASIRHYRFESEFLDRLGVPHPVLERLYGSFGSHLGLSWRWWLPDSIALIWRAICTFRDLRSKNDVLMLQMEGVPVGTLVYDTYLRRYRQETMRTRSWGLLWTLIQAQFIASRTQQHFTRHQVVSVIPGDVAYIYSGIVARIAILRGIPTYSVMEIPCRLQPMDTSFYRRVPYWCYREQFAALPHKKRLTAKQQATKLIDARFSGLPDRNMAYMHQSSYASQNGAKRALLDNHNNKVLVLLHDFFDSPHIYRQMLFADFWEWICFTLERASQTPFEWYVKAHPNGLKGNDRIMARLQARFPKIHFLDPNTSNRQLVKEGVAAVFSVYGSAGHEFPYLGVPVVMAGDNPHVAYDFTLTPQTVDDYARLIDQAGKLRCDVDLDQLREFYYMHYCHYQSELPLDPVYPTSDFCKRMNLEKLSSKEQRNRYHKADSTLAYLLEQRTRKQEQKLQAFFRGIFV